MCIRDSRFSFCVATQKENLRKRFTGIPEHVVNFFWYVAEEVRQLMSLLGVIRLEELIGRTDLLQARSVDLAKTNGVDLSSLLAPISGAEDRSWLRHSDEAHGNGPILEDQLLADAELMAALENHGSISRSIEIINTCLLYTSPSPRDATLSRMPSSA